MYYYDSLVLNIHSKYRRYYHPDPRGPQSEKRERCNVETEKSVKELACPSPLLFAIIYSLKPRSYSLIEKEKLCFMLLYHNCKICPNCKAVRITLHHFYFSSPTFRSWYSNCIYPLYAI